MGNGVESKFAIYTCFASDLLAICNNHQDLCLVTVHTRDRHKLRAQNLLVDATKWFLVRICTCYYFLVFVGLSEPYGSAGGFVC